VLLVLGVLYAAVVVPIGAHKGNSLEHHLQLANQMLDGTSVYDAPPLFGTWWPPGALALLAPFALVARLSGPVAKGLFALASLSCLAWALMRAPAGRWAVVALALAAVCGPLQKDFENLNLNVLLLALVVATWRDLERRRDARAGVWLGLATAVKIFPALLVAYAAYRHRWRAAAWAAGVAALVTLLPIAPRGVAGARDTLTDWIAISAQGTADRRAKSQSLAALVDRTGAPAAAGIAASLALVAGAAWWLRRPRPLFTEVALVTHVAVLATPLVWEENFVLLYPAWVAILTAPPPASPWLRRAILVPAGVATSGIIHAWSRPVRVALYEAAALTWGALATLAVLARTPPLGDRSSASVD